MLDIIFLRPSLQRNKTRFVEQTKMMYSQCQWGHNDIHEASPFTLTLCLYSIDYLVTIGCDQWHTAIHLLIQAIHAHYHRWKDGVFTVTFYEWCNMSWIFGWSPCIKPGERKIGREGSGFACFICLKWLFFCFWILNFSLYPGGIFLWCSEKDVYHLTMHILYWFINIFTEEKSIRRVLVLIKRYQCLKSCCVVQIHSLEAQAAES